MGESKSKAYTRHSSSPAWAATLIVALSFASSAMAQTEAPDPPSASTDMPETSDDGIEAGTAPESGGLDSSHLRLSAGGLLVSGNSPTLALSSGADHRLRRGNSQLSTLASVNYGKSAPGPDAPYRTSVENAQARSRYDYFVLPRVATFLAGSVRRDRFQGLALRINIDPGIAYYFIDDKDERLWLEVGYDLQHDIRHDSVLGATLDGEEGVIKQHQTRHGGRLFASYDSELRELLSLRVAVEYLQSVERAIDWRLNADAALNAHIDTHFAVALALGIRHDNHPLPSVRETDSITSLSVVYAL
jgi:putative salt-induced outer membrane protein